ncbi:MAG: flagellar basal body P-ring formation protein FlgA [Acidobacteriia bacterium]|nr:flagellar basal body P-ring formation protein FlgA [Terriglobia bacterium]
MPLPFVLLAGCLAISAASDYITAGDLAPQFSGIETVPAETRLGLAPAPGAVRVFRVPELGKIASQFDVDPPTAEICVERPVHPLSPVQIQAAMRKVLPEGQIELLDFSHRPVPDGDLEFKMDGLREGPAGAFWWGSVRYGNSHLFPVWARVVVRVSAQRIVAVEDLAPGRPIRAEMVRQETHDEFPGSKDLAQSADQVIGRCPRTTIRSGSVIHTAQLDTPKDVLAGETVEVDVWNGSAHLKLDARAEGSGVIGQTIPVRNPLSQKRFLARVDAKGKVSVGGPAATQNP